MRSDSSVCQEHRKTKPVRSEPNEAWMTRGNQAVRNDLKETAFNLMDGVRYLVKLGEVSATSECVRKRRG